MRGIRRESAASSCFRLPFAAEREDIPQELSKEVRLGLRENTASAFLFPIGSASSRTAPLLLDPLLGAVFPLVISVHELREMVS